MTEDEVVDIVKSITVRPGDHLVVRYEYRTLFESMMDAFKVCLPEYTIFFFVNKLDDIRTIDEDGMRKLGWVREHD